MPKSLESSLMPAIHSETSRAYWRVVMQRPFWRRLLSRCLPLQGFAKLALRPRQATLEFGSGFSRHSRPSSPLPLVAEGLQFTRCLKTTQ